MYTPDRLKKYLAYILVISILLSILKTLAIRLYYSEVLLADLLFTLIVTIGQLLLWLGMRRVNIPIAHETPFGFSGRSYFYSFVLTVILLSLGAYTTLHLGLSDSAMQRAIPYAPWLGFLLFVILFLNLFALFIINRITTQVKGANSYRRFIHRSKHVDLVILCLESRYLMTSLLLLFFSLFGFYFLGWENANGMGAALIGLLMLFSAFSFGFKMENLLIGQSADSELLKRVQAILQGEEGLVSVISLKTLILDSEELLVAVHAEFKEHLSLSEINTITSGIEQDIRSEYRQVRRVYFDTTPHKDRL